MALFLADRVQETTAVTGTANATLLGAVSGFQTFAVIGNGNTTYYSIVGASEWETGIGTYSTSGPTLTRDTILSSSNSNAKVSFSAGTKNIFVVYPAAMANTTLVPQALTVTNGTATVAVLNNINGAIGNPATGGWLLPQAVTLNSFSVRLITPSKNGSVVVKLRYSTNNSYTGATLLSSITYAANRTTLQTVNISNSLPAQSTLYLDITSVGSSYPGAGLTVQVGYKYT